MPTIDVPVATYERLTRRAAALRTSVEALAVPALEKAANEPIPAAVEPLPMPPTPPGQLPYDEWKKVIDEMLARAENSQASLSTWLRGRRESREHLRGVRRMIVVPDANIR